ncbi:hypothetical protein D3C78_1251330 [compost metagenome]
MSQAINVTFMNPINGPTDRSTVPRPAITVGVSARVQRIRGVATSTAPARPLNENKLGVRNNASTAKAKNSAQGTAR